jgi:hypothetical protein
VQTWVNAAEAHQGCSCSITALRLERFEVVRNPLLVRSVNALGHGASPVQDSGEGLVHFLSLGAPGLLLCGPGVGSWLAARV